MFWGGPSPTIQQRAVSSNSLADLELELRTPWGLLASLGVWLVALLVGLTHADGLPPEWVAVASALLAPAWIGLSQLACGITPAAPKHVVWLADGSWQLRDGHGRVWQVALDPGSRRWGPLTLLVWRTQTLCWRVILTPASVGRDTYRRLSVRLRLRRHA